jgi:replicative DNA helicase
MPENTRRIGNSELPYSADSERTILAALLVNPSIFPDLELTPTDFYIIRHRIIFEAIIQLRKEGHSIDGNSVADILTDSQLRYIGGPAYLTQLLYDCPEPTIAGAILIEGRKHARTLREYRQRRMMLERAQELAQRALDIDTPLRGAL